MEIIENIGVYGVSYFTLSMLVAGIAQGKNRGGFNWWLLSTILTPPVALFFLLVSDKLPVQNEQSTEDQQSTEDPLD